MIWCLITRPAVAWAYITTIVMGQSGQLFSETKHDLTVGSRPERSSFPCAFLWCDSQSSEGRGPILPFGEGKQGLRPAVSYPPVPTA